MKHFKASPFGIAVIVKTPNARRAEWRRLLFNPNAIGDGCKFGDDASGRRKRNGHGDLRVVAGPRDRVGRDAPMQINIGAVAPIVKRLN